MVLEPGIPVAVRYLGVVNDREALIGTLIALKLSGLLTKICARLDWWLQLAAVLWTTYCTWNQFPVYHRSSLPLSLRSHHQEWVINCGKTLAQRLRPGGNIASADVCGAPDMQFSKHLLRWCISGDVIVEESPMSSSLALCTWSLHIPRTLQIRNTKKINSTL